MAALIAKWATEEAAPTQMPANPSATLTPTPTMTDAPADTPLTCPLEDEVRKREAAAVYEVAFSYANQPARSLLISDRPAFHEQDIAWLSEEEREDPRFLEPYLAEISAETMAGFIAANTPPSRSVRPTLPIPHEFLPSSEIDHLLGEDPVSGWSRFDAKYPNSMGYWTVSQVGFDCDLTQALLFLRHVYGYAGMTGTFYLLNKEGGGWVVGDEFLFSEA